MADPRFLRGDANLLFDQFFAENHMKMNFGLGTGARPWCPYIHQCTFWKILVKNSCWHTSECRRPLSCCAEFSLFYVFYPLCSKILVVSLLSLNKHLRGVLLFLILLSSTIPRMNIYQHICTDMFYCNCIVTVLQTISLIFLIISK